MATKTKKAKGKWKPHPEDAINLAALRWYALTIERTAIQIYATDSRKYEGLEGLLKALVIQMNAFGKLTALGSSDECPDGYVRCNDGLCAPMCDQFE